MTTYFLLFLFFLVSLYVPNVLYVWQAQDDHEVVNELDLDTVVEEYRGVFDLLGKSVAVGLHNTFGENVEEFEEAVVKGKDEVGGFCSYVLRVGVSPGPHVFYALFALVIEEGLLGVEPFCLEVFIELAYFLSEHFIVVELALDELRELVFGHYDTALGVSSEEKDLVEVFRDDVALLN